MTVRYSQLLQIEQVACNLLSHIELGSSEIIGGIIGRTFTGKHRVTSTAGFQDVLVATDFSRDSEAALKVSAWVVQHSHGKMALVHVVDDLRRSVHLLSSKTRQEVMSGDGPSFEKEIRLTSDQKLRILVNELKSSGISVSCETLVGDAFVEITHDVQQKGHDLVVTGTRGISGWKQFFVGSTAKKLIRNCPSAVWIVKKEHATVPRVVLAPTDFSDVSRKAVLAGLWVAETASAEFHLVHVIDSSDVPEDLLDRIPMGSSAREEVSKESERRLTGFLATLGPAASRVVPHLTWGHPWQEICRIATKHQADLITMGTVGRSGVKGVLLGNTAERILDASDCSILTIKPDDYTSPIAKSIS